MQLARSLPARRLGLRPGALYGIQAALAAFLVASAVIVSTFTPEALPASYLVRPMLVAAAASLVVGAGALLASRHAAIASATITAGLLFGTLWMVAAAATVAIVALVARIRGRRLPDTAAGTLVVTGLFCLVSVVPAASSFEPLDLPTPAARASTGSGPNIYLVLMDGHPRADTLHSLGIDIEPFVGELELLGFDSYPNATSGRTATELTLLALLEGSEDTVPVETAGIDQQRSIRRALATATLPSELRAAGYRFVAIESPIGHVTFPADRNVNAGGMTDLEAAVLARAPLGAALRQVAPTAITESLRGHFEGSLISLEEVARSAGSTLVFAHLLAPHPPFMYGAGQETLPVPDYWPEVQLFESVLDITQMPWPAYRAELETQIRAVHARLLATISTIVREDPDAVIVVFSDHGARYSFDEPAEWSRSFLAARTPGRARLFDDEPRATSILREVVDAYGLRQ